MNRLWLAFSFLVGIVFVPLDSKVPVVAAQIGLAGAFAAPFVTLFVPTLAIAAVSEERPRTISISILVGVASSVAVTAAILGGLPQAGVLVLAMFMACLLSAPAIIAGASVGSWLKTSPSPASLFERTLLMKILAFAIGALFVEIIYHLPSTLPFGMLGELAVGTLVLFLVSLALSVYSDRKPWSIVFLMLAGAVFGVVLDVSLDTKVDRNLWPIEIVIVCVTAAPGVILGTTVGTKFGIRRRNRVKAESANLAPS